MSIGYLQVERADTNVPLEVLVSDKNGGVTGLTLVVAIRDGDTANSWLDFFDSTFKTVGWTTRQAAMAEVSAANAPGVYRLEVDLSAVSIPAGTHFLVAEYDASGAKSANGLDIIQLRDSVYSGVNVASLDANAVNSSVIATDAIDAGALATDAVNEIRDAILSDSTPFAGANIDAAISSRAAPGAAMDLVANAVDATAVATGAIDADAIAADAITAAKIAADAIGSSELATTAVNEIRDAILSDSTPFAGANIDATISSRAAPGAAMDLVANAVDATAVATGAIDADAIAADAITAAKIAADAIGSSELATTAVNEIRDAILSDSTPFAGANIDAAISSRAAPGAAMDLVTDALDAAALATSAVNEFADGLLARPISNVESAAFRTLYGAIAKLVNRVAVVGATLTVYETDDTTAVATQTVTSDAAADPITELNTV